MAASIVSIMPKGMAAGRPGGRYGRLVPQISRRRRMRRIEYFDSLVKCINFFIETPPQRAARTRMRFLVFRLVLELVTLRTPRSPPTSHKLWLS